MVNNYTPTTEDIKGDSLMNDFTPTTEEARQGSIWLGDEFDRWLAKHEREVKAEAWEEGALTDWGGFVRDKDIISANPYRQGETDV